MFARMEMHERHCIYNYLKEGYSFNQIAKTLKRSMETIRREVQNNGGKNGYNPNTAQKRMINKRKMQGNKPTHLLHYDLIEYIDKNYDPQKKSFYVLLKEWREKNIDEKLPTLKTIYNWLFKGYLDTNYDDILRPRKRREKVIKSWKRMLGKPISLRDKEQDMEQYGHWEIGLVVGQNRNKGYVITLLERKSRYALTIKTNTKKPEVINQKITNLIEEYGDKIFRSITADNGLEFNNLWELTDKYNIAIYYAFPYSSWQRGRNENWNSMLRRFFPKSTNFLRVTEEDLETVTNWINDYPRLILQGNSPKKNFIENCLALAYN